MKSNISIFILLCLGIASCSITGKLEKDNSRIRLSQPSSKQKKDTFTVAAPKLITYTDTTGVTHFITRNETDETTGEEISVVDLAEVTVTAQSKNVAERFGKVNLDFIVTVPGRLISNKWQLQLTPILHKTGEENELDKIFLSGADFLKTQRKGYAMYQAFINSIVPDSAYLQQMFNRKGYRRAMADMEEEFYQSWKKDMLSEKEYIDWSTRTNQRYLLFNGVMEGNKNSLNGNTKTVLAKLPAYWLYREIDESSTPGKYRSFLSGDYSIERKEITPDDSICIAEKYFNYKKIAENEKKKELLDEKYKSFVRFPYEQARLDTIIEEDSTFRYYYSQEIATDDNVNKLQLTLNGLIVAKDESTYAVPSSDTITYFVSSMVQFLDKTPRYKLKIIERKAEVNLMSFISYKSGKVVIDEKLGANESELAKILDTYKKLNDSGELVLDSISMVASSSPEGSAVMNKELSKQRANSLKKYLAVKTEDAEGVDALLTARWIGEDWQRLVSLIKKNGKLNHKNEILDLVGKISDFDMREKGIRTKFPEDYTYIRENLYPELRGVNFKFNLHRRGMIKDTVHTTVIDSVYQHGTELLEAKKYKEAFTVLSDYNDFNTAICMMSLGYDPKAYEILLQSEDSPNRNYLLSILSVRMKREEEAVKHLIKACEADETKIWRGRLDPEINSLMQTYNLYPNEN